MNETCYIEANVPLSFYIPKNFQQSTSHFQSSLTYHDIRYDVLAFWDKWESSFSKTPFSWNSVYDLFQNLSLKLCSNDG